MDRPSEERPLVERVRRGAALACLLLAGALCGWAWTEHARAARPLPRPAEVRVLGEAVDPTDARERAEAIDEAWRSAPIALVVGDERLARTRGELGARLDVDALAALLTRAADPASHLVRSHVRRAGSAPLELAVDVVLDPGPTLALLSDRKDLIDVRPQAARMRPRTGEVVPERLGRTLDVHASLDALEAALARGEPEVRAVVVEELPHRTARELEGVRVDALLGFYETRYSTLEESEDRTYNLRVAVQHIDGLVVMPGEVFDFNGAVGPRTEANGFRPAPQIAGGELVDGVGGGTCQVAGTLHASVFFAGLPVVERHPHSRPSAYLWMGLDATVVYPDVDLRFRNDRAFPLVIGMTMEGGVLRAEIRGAESHHLVTFTRRIDATVPFPTREESDPELPAGVRVLAQRGVPGFRITWFRTLRDPATNQAVRERSEDEYPPTTEIIRVGTGAAPPPGYVAPPGDAHLPYTADAYLVATVGPGIEGLAITRR
jgi:vancomycin resistance protein YoaR